MEYSDKPKHFLNSRTGNVISLIVIYNKEKVEEVFSNKLIDSLILNEAQYKKLMSLCEFGGQKWKLLYRASRDGFKAQDFHNKCDSKSNTLTVVKATSGCVFGGYTGASWSQTDGLKEDQYAFIFSLLNAQHKPVKIKCTETSDAIFCNAKYGPSFGNNDFRIYDMSNKDKQSVSSIGYTYCDPMYEYSSDVAMTLLANSNRFRTSEIEVYCKDYPPLSQV